MSTLVTIKGKYTPVYHPPLGLVESQLKVRINGCCKFICWLQNYRNCEAAHAASPASARGQCQLFLRKPSIHCHCWTSDNFRLELHSTEVFGKVITVIFLLGVVTPIINHKDFQEKTVKESVKANKRKYYLEKRKINCQLTCEIFAKFIFKTSGKLISAVTRILQKIVCQGLCITVAIDIWVIVKVVSS